MMKRSLLASVAALAAGAAAGFLTVGAHATEAFSAGSAFIGGLGDEIDSGYDTLSITGLSGDWNTGSPQTIANLEFTAGYNCDACTSTPSGLLGFSLRVGSVTETANLGWAWLSTSQADTLNITAPGDMTYVQSGGEVDVVSFAATPTSLTSAGGPVDGNLTASVDVPEPATLGLLGVGLAGLAAIGLIRRRRG